MIESRALRRRIICLMLALILAALPAIAGARALYPGATPTTEYTALDDQRKAQIPLVNYAHTLPDDFTLPQVKGRAQGDYAVAGGFSPLVNLYEQRHSFRLAGSDIWLCQHVYAAMERMFAAAEAEGMNGFIITSGYRSRERQQEIYAETELGLAATPGASEHETGLSFDVTAYSDNGDFGSTPQYAWLIANCWQYGFILRYPAGTQDITGITGESWHFRYVGQDAAQEILARDITLEQYLEGVTLEPLSTAGVWASYEAGPAAAAEPTLQPADQAASGSTALPADQANSGSTALPAEPTPQPAATPEPPPATPWPTVSVTREPAQVHTFELEGTQMQFTDDTYAPRDGEAVIYLAGGCFWGLEKLMQSLDGVTAATNGYANGTVPAPDYRRVCAGETGHRETVRVEYDPERISLDDLLYAYFEVIDPELVDRQGHDIGSQYQAGIYYIDDAARDTVQRVSDDKRAQYPNFAVEIAPLSCFYAAEEYHQDYLDKNPGGYCHIPFADIRRIADELNGRSPDAPQ